MAHLLRNLKITRVALVDKGANFDPVSGEGAHIALYKRAVKKETLGQVHVDAPTCKCADCAIKHAKESAVNKTFLSKLAALFKEEGIEMADDGLTDDEREKRRKKEEDEALAKMDGVAKRHVDALQKRVEEAEAKAKTAEDIAKSETQIRKRSEMVSVLKSFRAVPLKMEGEGNDVDRFLKMQASDPDGYTRTIELLRASDAQLADSILYKNIGTERQGSVDAWTQIEAKADALVAKDANMTREQAIEKVMDKYPELVKQYRQGQQ